MTAPAGVKLGAWPPPTAVIQVATGQPIAELCPHHRPPQQISVLAHQELVGLVVSAFRDRCGPDQAAFAVGMAQAHPPLCCRLGDEQMEALARQVRPVWALRS